MIHRRITTNIKLKERFIRITLTSLKNLGREKFFINHLYLFIESTERMTSLFVKVTGQWQSAASATGRLTMTRDHVEWAIIGNLLTHPRLYNVRLQLVTALVNERQTAVSRQTPSRVFLITLLPCTNATDSNVSAGSTSKQNVNLSGINKAGIDIA